MPSLPLQCDPTYFRPYARHLQCGPMGGMVFGRVRMGLARQGADVSISLQDALAEVHKRRIVEPRRIHWVPADVKFTAKQQQFIDDDREYLLYGGARGSGKSYATLGSALKYVDHPEYGCVILRKTYPELEDLINLSHQWLDRTPAVWSEAKKLWTFPSGARLFFGHMQHAKDRAKYKGFGQLHSMFFDELDTFEREDWLSGIENLRRTRGSQVPIRKRGTSNPPTSSGRCNLWVITDWVIQEKYGHDAVIFTRMEDNPHLDIESYRAGLAERDDHDRAALIDGKWSLIQAGRVYPLDAKNLVQTVPPTLTNPRYYLGFDIGASLESPTTAFALVCFDQDTGRPLYVVESWASTELNDEQYQGIVEQYLTKYPNLTAYGDHGALGAKTIRFLNERGLPVLPAEKSQKTYHQSLLRGAFERGEVKICQDQNEALLNHLHALRCDERGVEDPKAVKHLTDAMLYACRPALKIARVTEPRGDAPQSQAEAIDRAAAAVKRRKGTPPPLKWHQRGTHARLAKTRDILNRRKRTT